MQHRSPTPDQFTSSRLRVGVVVFLARDADKKEQPQEEDPILPKFCPRTTMLASRVVMLAIGIFVLFAALPLGSSATALPAYCGAPPVLAPPPLQ